MYFGLKHLPERTEKPRNTGFTMVMDKGLSLRQAEDFLSTCEPYTDIIKLGFGTAVFTPNLDKKLALYREAGVPYYFGGTLFEAFIARGQFEDFRKLIDRYQLEFAEVSDGSLEIPHDEKCGYVSKLSEQVKVLSEVGSKDIEKIIAPYKWIELMNAELEAGAYKLIAEARESGTVGIFRRTGEVRSGLIDEIMTKVDRDKIIWEAPQKSQQVWFIKFVGSNVNLGNIAPVEVIPLETLRMGLRGDTFEQFLPKDLS